ncbi:MAG TPA: tRNA (adenine-N1)-methyltransferase [Candidatus Thermoplasmatota archaeon]|nr:tRNA (adenine-N1)-methyltransferase [Candidatus Thermoplasmatota archaeon]
MPDAIQAGDRVLLYRDEAPRRVVEARDETARVPGLGVLNLGDLVGRAWGSKLTLGADEYLLLRPILRDRLLSLDRGPQIVLPKDASRIVLECGLHAGSRVAEAGVGSGALTMVLAHAVAPTGRVLAFDNREDHLNHAKRNLKQAGLDAVVEFKMADVTKGIAEKNLDAVVLDLPEPENVVPHAHKALGPSGAFASYSPLVIQMERTVEALRAHGFIEIRSLELLERPWMVHERGSRPETTMLAHTGFLTFARRP